MYSNYRPNFSRQKRKIIQGGRPGEQTCLLRPFPYAGFGRRSFSIKPGRPFGPRQGIKLLPKHPLRRPQAANLGNIPITILSRLTQAPQSNPNGLALSHVFYIL